MAVSKRVICPEQLRHVPPQFSWLDHRLVRDRRIAGRSLIIVLLDSWGKLTRIGDANRIRRWLEREFSNLSVSG